MNDEKRPSFEENTLQEGQNNCGVCGEKVRNIPSFCSECANQVLVKKKDDLRQAEEEVLSLKDSFQDEIRKLKLEDHFHLVKLSKETQRLREYCVSAEQSLRADLLKKAQLENRLAEATATLKQLEGEQQQKHQEKKDNYILLMEGMANHLEECRMVEKRRRMHRTVNLFGLFDLGPSIPQMGNGGSMRGYSTILSLPLANSGDHKEIPPEVVSAALSHVGRLVVSLASELGTQLPHPLVPPRFIEIENRMPQPCHSPGGRTGAKACRFMLGRDGSALALLQENIKHLLLFKKSEEQRWIDHIPVKQQKEIGRNNLSYVGLQEDQLFPTGAIILNLYLLFSACSKELIRLKDGPDLPLPLVESPGHIYNEMEQSTSKKNRNPGETFKMKLVTMESDPEVDEKFQLFTDVPLNCLMREDYFSMQKLRLHKQFRRK